MRVLGLLLVLAHRALYLDFNYPFTAIDSGVSLGVTALHPYKDSVLVGTKQGDLLLLDPSNEPKISHIDSPSPSKPIYSLQASSDTVFCGSADRYIHVYEDQGPRGFVRKQSLGPHTGWVKSLLFTQYALKSIGCNCVENWSRLDDNKTWSHEKKTTIESSPDAFTSSSDLLCLAAWHDYTISGGVDGRIHIWDEVMKPIHSFLAHNGRVNSVIADDDLLISGGHDGCIKVWSIQQKEKGLISERQQSSILLKDARITTFHVARDSKNDDLQIIAGSHTGYISCLLMKSGVIQEMQRFKLDGNPVVNGITISRDSVVLGHSFGCTILR